MVSAPGRRKQDAQGQGRKYRCTRRLIAKLVLGIKEGRSGRLQENGSKERREDEERERGRDGGKVGGREGESLGPDMWVHFSAHGVCRS